MTTRISFSESLAAQKNVRLKKGDKLMTAAGNIETFERINSNGNVETVEGQYSWSLCNLKKINQ